MTETNDRGYGYTLSKPVHRGPPHLLTLGWQNGSALCMHCAHFRVWQKCLKLNGQQHFISWLQVIRENHACHLRELVMSFEGTETGGQRGPRNFLFGENIFPHKRSPNEENIYISTGEIFRFGQKPGAISPVFSHISSVKFSWGYLRTTGEKVRSAPRGPLTFSPILALRNSPSWYQRQFRNSLREKKLSLVRSETISEFSQRYEKLFFVKQAQRSTIPRRDNGPTFSHPLFELNWQI